MSNELKVGILAAFAIAVTIWGYKFMQGKNLLNASNAYYVKYDNVDQLTASSPILIRGLRVGTVESVRLDTDMKSVIATLDIDKEIKIPKDAEALVVSTSIMGGKAIEIIFDKACSGDDCAKRGSYINGRAKGALESMLGSDNVQQIFDDIKSGLGGVAKAVGDSLTDPEADSEIAKSIKSLTATMANLESITSTLDKSLGSYDRRLLAIMDNIKVITKGLSESTPEMQSALANMNSISKELSDAHLGETLTSAGDLMKNANTAVGSLEGTLASATEAVDQLASLLSKMESDEGSIGQMLNSTDFYDQALLTTTNLQLLLQDFRLNPKRYVNVSVFGKKQKDYNYPEDDPAYKE
jgi:phospholipid/cholesterol/gamma-HCH transport system substrate-binding protein